MPPEDKWKRMKGHIRASLAGKKGAADWSEKRREAYVWGALHNAGYRPTVQRAAAAIRRKQARRKALLSKLARKR